jgi:murein DD-endopeptidase MepM/ murein hydrolase activator NlpD
LGKPIKGAKSLTCAAALLALSCGSTGDAVEDVQRVEEVGSPLVAGLPGVYDNAGGALDVGQTFVADKDNILGLRVYLGDPSRPDDSRVDELRGPAWLVLYDARDLSAPRELARAEVVENGASLFGLSELQLDSPVAVTIGQRYFFAIAAADGFGVGLGLQYDSTYANGAQATFDPSTGAVTENPLRRDVLFEVFAGVALQLPWASGEVWRFTSGPHGMVLSGLDFAPPLLEPFGRRPSDRGQCARSRSEQFYVTAAAAGSVVKAPQNRSDPPEVVIEHLDGTLTNYFHVCTTCRQTPRDFGIEPGRSVAQGQRIGHPSCDTLRGRLPPSGAHVHFSVTRRGERIPATQIGTLSGYSIVIDPIQPRPCPYWAHGRFECAGILRKEGRADARSVVGDPVISENTAQ